MSGAARRPLTTRSNALAIQLARRLSASAITPNQISGFSIVVALIGAIALIRWPNAAGLLVAALMTQLRLLCNLLDGMVAVEGGKGTPNGALYNEVPDRIADSLLLVGLGYATGYVEAGWLAALLAAITAYIRVLGGTLGQPQDFRGPQAKPQRMAVLTAGCVLGAIELFVAPTRYALTLALAVIVLGSAWTCVARLRAISARL
jgi:phosphatidylglycerophosphate synthase